MKNNSKRTTENPDPTLYETGQNNIQEVLGLDFPTEDPDEELLYASLEGTATEIGGLNPGAITEDLTQDEFSENIRLGGPTGSDRYTMNEIQNGPSYARGVDKHPTGNVNKELAAKVAADNEMALYKP